MADTNPYSAWTPGVDPEQEEKQQQEEAKLAGSIPIVQDVLDWFDAQIALYKNPNVISGVNPSTPAEDVKAAVLLAQAQGKDFREKRDRFRADFGKYIQEAKED